MVTKSDALLIFDFDNNITNGHMHNAFSRLGKNDFNSAAKYAVTDVDIRNFLDNTDGIKNEEELKTTLQSALLGQIEVNVASYTGYPNAVKRVMEDYLGLSKEQISVFGGFPVDYDIKLQGLDVRGQQNKVGKNLHICKAIAEYKDKHGRLPKTVILVDDSPGNIRKINEFMGSVEKEWLEKNGLDFGDVKNIKFEGIQVPKKDQGIGYLGKVQEFISANSVREPIYENLKTQEPIYENLNKEEPIYSTVKKSTISLAEQMRAIKLFCVENYHSPKETIRGIQDFFKETVMEGIRKQGYSVKSNEEKRSEIIVKGSKPIIDVEQIITDALNQVIVASDKVLNDIKNKGRENSELKQTRVDLADAEPIYQNTQDIKTAQAEPIYQNTEELLSPPSLPPKPQHLITTDANNNIDKGEKENAYTEKSTISLTEGFKTIKSFFADYGQSIINTICRLFKKMVTTKIEEQGYAISSEKGKSEITIYSNKPIDIEKIKTDAIDTSLIKVMELDEKKMKNLGKDYKGVELKQKTSKSLEVNSQKKDANSNSFSQSQSNEKPYLPPRNHTEKVIQGRNVANNSAGRNW